MNFTRNQQVLLKSRSIEAPLLSNFESIEGDVPVPGPNELLMRTIYLSIDPYMRGRLSERKSYAEPLPVGSSHDRGYGLSGRAV
jgi:NADPH-dependent curcumin reductase